MSASDSKSTPIQVPGFEVQERLGHGGMGTVWRAWDVSLERTVALKLMDLTAVGEQVAHRRIQREARAVASLDHPNICTVHQMVLGEDGQLVLVMTYYKGEDLAQRLRRGHLDLEESVVIAAEICAALVAAHDVGLIHRDIKPSNVMLTSDGRVVVLDFGVAKTRGALDTNSGAVGTPAYMSPEQLRGDELDATSDIWSAGAVLFEMLTGNLLVGAHDQLDFVTTALLKEPTKVANLPAAITETINRILRRSLAPQVSNRYASSSDMLSDLRDVQARVSGRSSVYVADAPLSKLATGKPALTRQRRHLYVVSVNLQLDEPSLEARYDRIEELTDRCERFALQYGGEISVSHNQFQFLTFGLSLAREDDARRAIRAALELRTQLEVEEDLQLRIAVHSGQALFDASTTTGSGRGLLTQVYNEVETLSKTSPLGEVLISSAVAGQVNEYFNVEEVPATSGSQSPTFIVLDEVDLSGRFLSLREHASRALVGREEELAILQKRWRRAQDGAGQVVVMSGEAGIGKSRLCAELVASVQAEEGADVVLLQCSPHLQDSALHPLLAHLSDVLDRSAVLSRGDGLLELAHQAGAKDHPGLPALAGLLGIEVQEPSPAGQAPGGRRFAQLIAFSAALLAPLPRLRPTLIVFEDLHWGDGASLALVQELTGQAVNAPVMLVVTHRPDADLRVTAGDDGTLLALPRLGRGEARQLIESIQPESRISPRLQKAIVERSDGVPLFLEELARGLMSPSAEVSPELATVDIPNTLEGLLAARLDRVREGKPVAQVASVLGRRFPRSRLEAVWERSSARLNEGLELLERERLLNVERPMGEDPYFVFKHALVQEAAYESMVQTDRTRYHGRAADALMAEAEQRPGSLRPEEIAHHLEASERASEAAQQWFAASSLAVRSSSNQEGIRHAHRGLEACERIEAPVAKPLQLQLQIALGLAAMTADGYASPRVVAAYSAARGLCEELGQDEPLFPILFGLWTYNCVTANHEGADALAAQMLKMGAREDRTDWIVEACVAAGITAFYRARYAEAREIFARGLENYFEPDHLDHLFIYGQDPAVVIESYQSWLELILGNATAARERSDAAIERARRLRHPHSLAYALTFAAWHRLLAADVGAARPLLEESTRVCIEGELGIFLALSQVQLAWCDVAEEPSAESLSAMKERIASFTAVGGRLFVSLWEGVVADGMRKVGQLDEATDCLKSAFDRTRATDEQWAHPALLEIKAKLAAAGGDQAAAREGLEAARRELDHQGAAPWSVSRDHRGEQRVL